MKIQFGSNGNDESRPLLVGLIASLLGSCCCYFQMRIRWSHDLILKSPLPNMTLVKVNKHCGLPYDDYRCAASTPTHNISQYCLNDAQIISTRLLPILVFLLALCIIYDLFTVSQHCIRLILHVSGITSAFTFVVITILIYNKTCAQFYVTLFVFEMSGILFLLAIRDTQIHSERRRASHNR